MSIIDRLFSKTIERRVQLAVRALDDSRDRLLSSGEQYPRDRRAYDRRDVLEKSLDAWRENPLARRITSLTTQYVVGTGVVIECPHAATHRFIGQFWNNRLNKMPQRVRDWCDELTRTGDLFIILSTDAAGMSYVRAIPSIQVKDIATTDNDVDQEVSYEVLENAETLTETRTYLAYNPNADRPNEDGSFSAVILHYAINRPVGAKFGEPDLAPMLRWFSRYSAWLEDRVRLNRFRQVFNFVVTGKYQSKTERLSRQAELNANPPSPGSILVCDESEAWEVIHPKLDSFEALQDGLAVKKVIAAGCGIPLHFLAEPESATRTTAEAAGGPTYRHFEQRQDFFMELVHDLLEVVIARRNLITANLPTQPQLTIHAGDISGRDNSALASAAAIIVGSFNYLYQIQAIDKAELLRLAYRFCGETVNVEDMLARAEKTAPVLITPTKPIITTPSDLPKEMEEAQ